MTIPPDLEAQILRYYHVEKWRVGTIARQLHVHHGTVARVLAQAGLPRIGPPARRSQVEPYLSFIHQTLEKFPTLTASRLYAMVCERGYRGSGDHFRHLIACYRPRPAAEAYLRLRSLPGEQGQVDWGHFGHLVIGRARRPLMAFVTELFRITKPGGRIKITTPHYSNPDWPTDPTHRNHFNSYSFNCFIEARQVFPFYTQVKLKPIRIYVSLANLWRALGLEFVVNLDQRWPAFRFTRKFWEFYLSTVLRGKELHFEFEVVKEGTSAAPGAKSGR